MHEALSALPIPAITIHVSNRKVAQGFYQSVGIEDDRLVEVLRVVDKLDKIGTDAVAVELVETVGITRAQAEAALGLATMTGTDPDQLRARVLGALDGAEPSALLLAGLDELESLLRVAARRRPGAIVADLKIARGLDYYTGTVYESFMAGHEDLGSVCSGGRYDSLASNGKRTFPGVGISIGLSRLLSRVMGAGLIEVTRAVPTAVLVAVTDEEHRAVSDAVADACGSAASPPTSPPRPPSSASRSGSPTSAASPSSGSPGAGTESDSVKDIRSGEQIDADPATWSPASEADLAPQILLAADPSSAAGA